MLPKNAVKINIYIKNNKKRIMDELIKKKSRSPRNDKNLNRST